MQICKTYHIDEQKISVTYNSGEHLLKQCHESSLGSLQDWPEPFIFYVGLIQPRKNLPRLIKAFDRMISHTNLPHHLVLGGKWGWKNQELIDALNRSKYRARIHFKGYLPDRTVRSAMAKADLFVFPSLFEGFGIPPMEAQSCGTPALVSNSTCFPEIYGDSVQYCDPKNIESICQNMTRILTDKSLQASLIEAGFKRLSYFRWKAAAQTVLEQYRKIMS
jgi:glycosyltransferase involved in cell wall biosynthesis